MDTSLEAAVGAPIHVKIAGRDVLLPPMNFDSLAALHAEIISRRPNMLEEVAKTIQYLPAEMREAAWLKAVDGRREHIQPSGAELTSFLLSGQGLAFCVWATIETKNPGIFSRDDVLSSLKQLHATSPAEYDRFIERWSVANGWITPTANPPQGQQTEATDTAAATK